MTEGQWEEHYRDEKDAVFLYSALARTEAAPARRKLFERLAAVETRHVERWTTLFRESGQAVPSHSPSLRMRLLATTARFFGSSSVLPLIVAEEGREVEAYLRLARSSTNRRTHEAAVEIATDSALHARELAGLLGRAGEPWHGTGASGYLRSVVYGFNDGLTANFGLVAGVIGASMAPHLVIVTGIAGAMADALSMGASGYLAAKSEAEVSAHQIAMEREEILLMPDLEEEELGVIYEAKGLTPERARETAKAMIEAPEQALAAMVREELNIREADLTPLTDGVVTGVSTAVGAAIPIVPFLVFASDAAVWVSLTVSMLAHFAIGAARSVFTGRGTWASGRDMFIVGFGVAAVGYVIGELITRLL